MLLYILYIVFFYFTHNQLYASSHFTGSSQHLPIVLKIVALINIILEIAFIIRLAIQSSLFEATVLFISSLAILNVVKRIICKVVLNNISKDFADNSDNGAMLWNLYNHHLNITTTIQALVGLLINPVIIVAFFVYFYV